jgi:hypothetical protein
MIVLRFDQDRREGTGTMMHANGDQYTGSWLGDMRHGSGNCQVCSIWVLSPAPKYLESALACVFVYDG